MTTTIRSESTDALGRILPAIPLGDVVRNIREGWYSPRMVVEALAAASQAANDEAYAQIREAAYSVGITHSPPDLAGRRYRL